MRFLSVILVGFVLCGLGSADNEDGDIFDIDLDVSDNDLDVSDNDLDVSDNDLDVSDNDLDVSDKDLEDPDISDPESWHLNWNNWNRQTHRLVTLHED